MTHISGLDASPLAPTRPRNEVQIEEDTGAEAATPNPPASAAAATAERVRWRDLPNKDQLLLLALCRLSEPLSNVCLLPYIFYLVRSVLPEASAGEGEGEGDADRETAARVSAYSGLLVAAFPLAQCAVSLAWGRASDRHGRRASVLAGLAGAVAANAGFGLSRSLGALFAWRAVAGLAAGGPSGLLRAATAEAAGPDPRLRARAFLALPLVFNAGTAAALALGGLLAEPADGLPGLFGPHGWFNTAADPDGVRWVRRYPYALPALLNAAVLASVLVLAVLGLRETLPGREGHSDSGLRAGQAIMRCLRRLWSGRVAATTGGSYVLVEDDVDDQELVVDGGLPDEEKPVAPPSGEHASPGMPFRAIWTRKVLCSLVSFGLLPLHNAAFMHIFPVFLSAAPADNSEATFFAFTGGLGLRSATIGVWLSIFGVCGILLQLFIYPRMQASIGTRGVFRIALIMFPITYVLAPYLSLLIGSREMRWVFLGAVMCSQIMARTMAIPSTVILLTESVPHKTVLGTVHGAGNMLASLARAAGPAVGGYVFALGVEEGVIGLVWWLYLAVIALAALAWSYFMDVDQPPAE